MIRHAYLMVVVVFCLLSVDVSAYIDPGTGSVVAGSMWPILAAIFSAVTMFFVKYFWAPIKGFFSRFIK